MVGCLTQARASRKRATFQRISFDSRTITHELSRKTNTAGRSSLFSSACSNSLQPSRTRRSATMTVMVDPHQIPRTPSRSPVAPALVSLEGSNDCEIVGWRVRTPKPAVSVPVPVAAAVLEPALTSTVSGLELPADTCDLASWRAHTSRAWPATGPALALALALAADYRIARPCALARPAPVRPAAR